MSNKAAIFEIRRSALAQAVDSRLDGKQVLLAERIGVRPDYVSRMLTTKAGRKNIGSDFAREIEVKLGLPPMWLDQPANAQPGTLAPAGMGTMQEIPLLKHEHHRPSASGLGLAVFAQDLLDAGLPAAELRTVELEDRGMAAIQRASRVRAVVNVESTEPMDGDVFLIDHGRRLKPRLLMLMGNQWVARSDCPDTARFPDIVVDGQDVTVVGRVAWLVSEL